jgi:hypothetical protein
MVLVSPIAFEPTDSRFLPKGTDENQRLALYSAAVAQVAKERNLAFIDLFTPTLKLFCQEPALQYTINGCHLNESGDAAIAKIMVEQLFQIEPSKLSHDRPELEKNRFEKLRSLINDKSWVHLQDYRMLVCLRRSSHLGQRNLPARVRQDPAHGPTSRSVLLGYRPRQIGSYHTCR